MSIPSATVQSAFTLKAEFLLNVSPKRLKMTDNTDWATLLDLAGGDTVKGIFKVVQGSTTVYENTSYASPDTTFTSATTDKTLDGPNLPLDSSSAPLDGDYVITYSVQIFDTSEATTDVETITITVAYENAALTPTITITHNCVNGTLTYTDSTSYVAGTTHSRTMTLHSPLLATGSPVVADVVTTNSSKIVTPIYTGTYTGTLENTITVPLDTISVGYVVKDIDAVQEHEVDCDNNLCDIYCCLNTLATKVRNNKGVNTKFYIDYLDQFVRAQAFAALYQNALDCNMESSAQNHYQQILDITGCEAGCSCTDNTPTLVTGVGGISTTDVEVRAGTYTTVATTTEGDTTVYTVDLTAATIALLNSIATTSVVSGSTSYLTVAEAGGVYTITWAGPGLQHLDYIITIALTAGPSYAVAWSKTLDTSFGARYTYTGDLSTQQPKVGWTISAPSPGTAVANQPMLYKIYEFLTTPDANLDKVFAQVVDMDTTYSDEDDRRGSFPNLATPDIVKVAADEIWVRFNDSDGSPLYHFEAIDAGLREIKLHVRITKE